MPCLKNVRDLALVAAAIGKGIEGTGERVVPQLGSVPAEGEMTP